ncbi:VOC family protein [SAR202 cluster bacterium AD-804-J14_MRT_500m]|nr:VOC family protein [SAR202 cluster bacterium AD-804-J14_MRT_500m]
MFHLNHIHLRSPDPHKSAQWYVEHLGAKIISEGKGLGNSIAIRMDLGGATINVSGSPTGASLPEGSSEYHWGLEHFGLDTNDITAAVDQLSSNGVEVLLPITEMPTGGTLIAYVKGPDEVMIELVQRKS